MDPEKAEDNSLGNNQGPRKNQKWNKLALTLLGLLCILASVALCIFAITYAVEDTGEAKVLEEYEKTQEQFESEVFLEESDGKTIKWKEEYTDLQSPASKELVNDFKSKMMSSMEEEGLQVEDVVVTKIAHAPVRIKKKKVADMENLEEISTDFLTSKDSGLSPQLLKWTEINEEMDNVMINFKTLAKPSKNAAAFGSGVSSGIDLVSGDIAKRMQSNGLKTSNLKMKANPTFLDVVNKTIAIAHGAPVGLVTTAKPQPKVAQVIECDFNPYESFKSGKKQLTVICESSCLILKGESLIGGTDAMFWVKSSICISAYFIGLIEDAGGILEVLNMGPGMVSGVDRNDPNIKQEVYHYRIVGTEDWVPNEVEVDNRYLIKYVGPRFVPTTPEANTVPTFSPYQPSTNPFVVTTKRVTAATPILSPDSEEHITVQYQVCCDGFKTQYNHEGSEARAKLEKRYTNAIKTAFEHICKCNGTSVQSVKFVEADKVADRQLETLATFRVNVETPLMVKCILDLEGNINEELTSQSRDTIGTLASIQYGPVFLSKIENEKEAGQRKKRSLGTQRRRFHRR